MNSSFLVLLLVACSTVVLSQAPSSTPVKAPEVKAPVAAPANTLAPPVVAKAPEIPLKDKYHIVKAVAEMKLMQEELSTAQKNLDQTRKNLDEIGSSVQTLDCGTTSTLGYTLSLGGDDPVCTLKPVKK